MHGNLGLLNLGLESHVSRGSASDWMNDFIRPIYMVKMISSVN